MRFSIDIMIIVSNRNRVASVATSRWVICRLECHITSASLGVPESTRYRAMDSSAASRRMLQSHGTDGVARSVKTKYITKISSAMVPMCRMKRMWTSISTVVSSGNSVSTVSQSHGNTVRELKPQWIVERRHMTIANSSRVSSIV